MQHGIYQVLTPAEASEIATLLNTQEWKAGKARTEKLTGSIKRNLELKPQQDGELVTALSKKVSNALVKHPDVIGDTMFKQLMACKFNKYSAPEEGGLEPGGTYHRHTDAPFMGPVRTDFTAVIALTDPDEYEGGDHHLVHPHLGEMVFRPGIGELMIYETGFPHWVDPVTKGSRISALTWIESVVPDARKRAILKTARAMSQEMESRIDYDNDDCPFRKWFVDIGVVHSGLHRMWSQR